MRCAAAPQLRQRCRGTHAHAGTARHGRSPLHCRRRLLPAPCRRRQVRAAMGRILHCRPRPSIARIVSRSTVTSEEAEGACGWLYWHSSSARCSCRSPSSLTASQLVSPPETSLLRGSDRRGSIPKALLRSAAPSNRTDVSFHEKYDADQGKLEFETDLVDLPSLLASHETRIQQ
jgi:hypothetical protein